MYSDNTKHIVINKDRPQEPALDFSFLRARGIELIQQFSGKSWSDFNVHDPGVTILESVCYALTDIAYRTGFPITDILADKQGRIDRVKNCFLPKETALTCEPVTLNDYRKVLIDAVPELNNVWLEPVRSSYTAAYTKGLYRVIIQPERELARRIMKAEGEAAKEAIRQEIVRPVKEKLFACRNTGDRFVSFQVLDPMPVYIQAELVIEKEASPEAILSKIYHVLETAFTHPVQFYTEADLLSKGYAIEDIYSGPLLQHGIITDAELTPRVRELEPLVLVNAASGLEGVLSIRKFALSDDGENYGMNNLRAGDGHFPFFSFDTERPEILLYRDQYPVPVRTPEAGKLLQKLRHAVKSRPVTSLIRQEQEIPLRGTCRNLQEYISIQTIFPAVYRINEEETDNNRPAASVAKGRQLKAYLMLFEQVLANTLSQLAGISDLFSTDLYGKTPTTYHTQPLYNIPDVKYILKPFTDKHPLAGKAEWEAFKRDEANQLTCSAGAMMEPDERYKDRKKRAYDHLLARFNIAVDRLPVELYALYYDKESRTRRIDLETAWKAAIICNISSFTGARGKAYNYLAEPGNEEAMEGLEKKLSLLLHIKNHAKRALETVVETYRKPVQDAAIDTWCSLEYQHKGADDEEEAGHQEEEPVSKPVSFRGHTEALFAAGTDINNYRISSYTVEGKTASVILFKYPQEREWTTVSKHPDEYAALQALKKTVCFFKEVSIESEGFHLVEHVLLSPSLEEPRYGFNFLDAPGKGLLKQRRWYSFAEREAAVAALLQLSCASCAGFEGAAGQLNELCAFPVHTGNDKQQPEDETKDIMCSLQRVAGQKTGSYPAFEYTVYQPEGPVLKEDFYNFRITVVLPSWPARFQDKSFRTFAENLFREECPAHMRLEFLWLPMTQMKAFEQLYFRWLKTLKDGTDQQLTGTAAQELVRFLSTGSRQQIKYSTH